MFHKTLTDAAMELVLTENIYQRKLKKFKKHNKKARKLLARGLRTGHPEVEKWKEKADRLQADLEQWGTYSHKAFGGWYAHPENNTFQY